MYGRIMERHDRGPDGHGAGIVTRPPPGHAWHGMGCFHTLTFSLTPSHTDTFLEPSFFSHVSAASTSLPYFIASCLVLSCPLLHLTFSWLPAAPPGASR